MRRSLRVLALPAAVLAASTLAGCDKPLPKITVQSGSFATAITPSTYCFDATHCRNASKPDLPVVTAPTDGKVLIDVPGRVAGQGWAVTALSLDGKKSLGGSGTLLGTHTYRIISSAADGQPFIVEVDQIRKGKADGSRWSFLIRVSPNS